MRKKFFQLIHGPCIIHVFCACLRVPRKCQIKNYLFFTCIFLVNLNIFKQCQTSRKSCKPGTKIPICPLPRFTKFEHFTSFLPYYSFSALQKCQALTYIHISLYMYFFLNHLRVSCRHVPIS